mmetsp:Transcript_53220/g.61005  ORF Transcript_53220/g.61005 Transcript_53220/m.61005 type:complete len:203 (-) Transcript_53220:101-709(-)
MKEDKRVLMNLNDNLEQVGLLHDSQEFFLRDFTITISVGFVDHFLQFIIGHIFSQFLGNSLQVSEGDFTSFIIIKQSESLEDFLTGVSLGHLSGHHIQEFGEVNSSTTVLVDVGDHLSNFFLLGFEAQSSHGNLQFLGIDGSTAVSIEQIESFLNFLLLFFGELVGSSSGSLGDLTLRCECAHICFCVWLLNEDKPVWIQVM